MVASSPDSARQQGGVRPFDLENRLAWLIAILVFGVLIAFHEYGHMWAAKRMGMKVDRFSIGFGPVLFSWKSGETEYVLSAVPLGGYVSIAGMADPEPAEGDEGEAAEPPPPDPRSFVNKKPWQQAFVLAAGPGANYLLAFIIGIPLLMFAATRPAVDSTRIGFVEVGGPASQSGLREGDRVLEVGGQPVQAWDPLRKALASTYFAAPDAPVPLIVERGDERLELSVTPRQADESTVLIGIGPELVEVPGLPFGAAVVQAGSNLWKQTAHSATTIGRMITGATKAQLSGPIGILGHTADQAKKGVAELMQTVWLISVALGFFNLLPIPALDGGRLLFVAYEAVTRRPVNQRVAGFIHAGGFVGLLLLLVAVSYGDIMRRFAGG